MPPPPTLPLLDLSSPHTFITPTKRINEGPDVSLFLTSLAYRDIVTFILQLNHSLIPRNPSSLPSSSSPPTTFPLPSTPPSTPSITALQALLNTIEGYIDEAPPETGPRRFGNVSFRKWHVLLGDRVGGLLEEGLLGETLRTGSAKNEVSNYLLGAFGSSQRLDYGTGHELSFVAFLGCLWKLHFFKSTSQHGEIERQIVLSVIEPYLCVVRKLILTYTLEPAGSHGVWGLDDHAFLPYIFGSAQLSRPINPTDPTPLEGSVRGAPRPSSVTNAQTVDDYRSTNMYFSAIGFINDVKKGPFWEHSPILFDISGIKDGWGKINKGMVKMFNAEVLSKFPVVQHFWFGSLFSWDQDPEASEPVQSVHMANQPIASAAEMSSSLGAVPPQSLRVPPPTAGTAAPWAQTTRMPPPPHGAAGTAASWAQSARIPAPPPGPPQGSLATARPTGPAMGGESAAAQITLTKAPWAT